ncbi:hypothetical protein N866_02080 [Actinotalea ferrariae CF5-4]|uniref:Uncharacterized protein n=1 Tax=Actinotalea ferrariae CF5-4 TaxID=948458 RepID=A0A021W0T6_9CELL|nr:hypothetical protein N866_02080 [Actinotalea ferrariae CF5-4]
MLLDLQGSDGPVGRAAGREEAAMGRWSWRAALRRTPGASRPDTRTVELGDGLAVVYERDEDGAVTERYVGIRGTPSRPGAAVAGAGGGGGAALVPGGLRSPGRPAARCPRGRGRRRRPRGRGRRRRPRLTAGTASVTGRGPGAQ